MWTVAALVTAELTVTLAPNCAEGPPCINVTSAAPRTSGAPSCCSRRTAAQHFGRGAALRREGPGPSTIDHRRGGSKNADAAEAGLHHQRHSG